LFPEDGLLLNLIHQLAQEGFDDGFDGFRTLVERGGALWFISLQLSILHPSCAVFTEEVGDLGVAF